MPTDHAPATERAAGPAVRGNPTLIVVMLSLCGTVVSLQQTLLLPLLAELPELLDTSVDNASWLVTATLLSGAVATPTVSRLADMHGKRRMMMVALAVSVAGSLLGALSEALPLLITARALQGVGMALVPVGIAIMRDELPRDRVPLGVAMMSATLAIGAGAALPLSGVISEHLDWHACFWLTGVVGVVLMAGARALIPESPVRTGGAFDLRGALLLSLSLSAILVALTKGGQWGWTSPLTLGVAAAGLVMLAAWVPLELRTPNPLIDVRVASRRAVLIVNVASVFAGFAMYANMLVSMQLLQLPEETGYGLGLDVLHAGLWMVPNAAAFGLMAPVSASLTRRLGPQTTLITGAAIMATTYVGRVYYSGSLGEVVVGSVLVGIGTALVYSALPTLIMRAVPITETASANGLNVLLRSLGTSTASAATAAITSAAVTTVGGQVWPTLQGLTTIFWLAAGSSAVTVALGVPMLRMREYAVGADRSGAEVTGATSQVVKGQVVDPKGRAIRGAVVTVLTPDGGAIDWGQADTEGRFSVAIPDAGDYLVVTTADGWRPRSRIMHLDNSEPLPLIGLRDRLTLEGTVTDADGVPIVDALVVLTRHTGEVVGSLRTDHDGHYAMPRPSNGRYVVTVAAREGLMGARAITVLDTARDVDLVLGTPLAGDPSVREQPTR
ncbi:MFS transporter [Nocardioides caldifontis]|uniref:MFS transporter n=1 Tax=Nocardioides caldifontis TaxID=2588938 RepID=UPI0011DFCF13|nr:MFS transporter [Nocardioides caldifontis]